MASLRNEGGYQHYFKDVPKDLNFETDFKPVLVSSCEELLQILSENKGKTMSVDIETNGLDFVSCEIVGFSFSFDSISGYYVPLRHEDLKIDEVMEHKHDKSGAPLFLKNGNPKMVKSKVKVTTPNSSNLDPTMCLKMIGISMRKAKTVLMHNAMFDSFFFKKEGIPFGDIKIFDTMCLTYNADTSALGQFGLKPASKKFLGREAIKFNDVIGDEKNFKYVPPQDAFTYAVMDSANTYGLFEKLYPILSSEGSKQAVLIDNNLIRAFISYYQESPLYIDKKIMKQYKQEIETRVENLEKSIYRAVGYPFNIRSRVGDLATALQSLGIDTGVKTDGGKMSTSAEALEGVAHKHPMVAELIELSSLQKQLSSYITKLSETESVEGNEDIGLCRVNYKLFATASGRLASGNTAKSKKDVNHYFENLNIQNLTKPSPAVWSTEYVGEDVEGTLMGWKFSYVGDMSNPQTFEYMDANKDKTFVEGMSPNINVRNAITVPCKDELIISADYSAEEIKLAGILLGEPNFIEPFKKGLDVHTEMAKAMFGESNYDKSLRKSAKIANFGNLYGGSAHVLHAQAKAQGVDMSLEEAMDIYNKWWKANACLKSRLNRLENGLRDSDFVIRDYFGRPRRLKYHMTSGDDKLYAYGKRSIASHMIQGTASSIMRLMLVAFYKNIFSQPEYRANYVSSVHDEINVRAHKSTVYEVVRKMQELMTYQPEGWQIPLTTSLELGYSLGELFAFQWNEDKTALVPKTM